VAEVSFTFSLGVCILGDVRVEDSIDQEKPPMAAPNALDAYGNAVDSERQSLLDGTLGLAGATAGEAQG